MLFTSQRSVNPHKVNSQIRTNNLQMCDCVISFLEFFWFLFGFFLREGDWGDFGWLFWRFFFVGLLVGGFIVFVCLFVCLSPITVACCSLL